MTCERSAGFALLLRPLRTFVLCSTSKVVHQSSSTPLQGAHSTRARSRSRLRCHERPCCFDLPGNVYQCCQAGSSPHAQLCQS